MTRHGPYVSPDAVSYVGTARGLAAGDGFTAPPGTPPVGHFAPLYPITLAALDVVGLDPVEGARWLNAVLLGATVLVVGLVLRRATKRWWPALVGGVLIICATDVLAYNSSALSDPLFVLLSLLAVTALAAYLDERRALLLVAATVVTSLALLTRYVGITLVAGGVVGLVLYGRPRRRRAGVEAAIFSLALVPVVAWVVWARGAHGQGSEGDIVFHPFGWRYLERGAGYLSEWIVPNWLPARLAVVGLVAVIAISVWAIRSSSRGQGHERAENRLPTLCALFAGAYVVVIIGDRLLVDASALLDSRLLLPVHVIAIVGLLALLGRAAPRDGVKFVSIATVSVLVLLQLGGGVDWVRRALDDGGTRRGGYTARLWRESAVVATLRNLPPDVAVYSNGPDAIWFLTGRATKMLPAEEDYLTGRSNPHYQTELAEMSARLRGGHGVVVYFRPIRSRHSLPTVADLRRAMPLQEASADRIGTIYAEP